MVKIIRVILLALCCWTITGIYVWRQPLSSVAPLVGARSGMDATVSVQEQKDSLVALRKKLLEVGVWQPLPQDKTSAVAESAFVGPPKPVFWTHVATVSTVSQRYVVLRSDLGEIKMVQEGGILPDGCKLVVVAPDHIEISSVPFGKTSAVKRKRRSAVEEVRIIKTYLN